MTEVLPPQEPKKCFCDRKEDYEDCLAICMSRERIEEECCFDLIQIIFITEECGWRKVARRWEMWEEIEVEPSRVKLAEDGTKATVHVP